MRVNGRHSWCHIYLAMLLVDVRHDTLAVTGATKKYCVPPTGCHYQHHLRMNMNTDRFTGEPADIPVITRCARCNAPIHEGDTYTDIGEPICQNCADDEDGRLGVQVVAGYAWI